MISFSCGEWCVIALEFLPLSLAGTRRAPSKRAVHFESPTYNELNERAESSGVTATAAGDTVVVAMAEGQRKQSETAKRQEKRRKEKLAAVQQQIEEGSLKIRKMTPEERKKYPPQDRDRKKKR